MPRDTFKTYVFVSLVVVDGDQRLLVDENPVGRPAGWYLPGGGVDHGESVVAAAIREAREETGIEVRPLGVLGVEQTLFTPETMRLRFLLRAEPVGGTLKQHADEHSLRAAWFTLDEVRSLRLRHADALRWLERADVTSGTTLASLDSLAMPPSELA